MLSKAIIGWLVAVASLCELVTFAHAQALITTPTKYGRVSGVAVGSGSETIYRYLGVPFAKPPTGDLRFKQPREPDAWANTKDAFVPSRDCMQILRYGLEKLGVQLNVSEDCLYLNVFTPSQTSNTTLLPVMVWIYGGGFIMGSSAIYDGSALARKGVVVVTFNYRLDAFGFLSTEDDSIPGNFGLLDQIFALKWVKENIAHFGGDPGQVTLFGESAGACSVSILSISPLAKGLFKRAIMESGSALSPWCISYPTTSMPPKSIATLIGSKVNCNSQDSKLLLDCLQKVNAESLINASVEVQTEQLKGVVTEVLRPRVERTFGVLPELPETLIARGQFDHLDVIRGYNSNEEINLKPNYTTGATRQEFRQFIRDKLFPFNIDSKDSDVNLFEQLYLGNASNPIEILQKSAQATSDLTFILPAILETELAVDAMSDRKQYLYEFSYRKSISTLPPWATAEHADELPFVFQTFNIPLWISTHQATADDVKVSNEIITLWTNFAKTGYPTSTLSAGLLLWTPFSISQRNLLNIDKDSTLVPTGRAVALDLYKRFLKSIENSGNGVVVG